MIYSPCSFPDKRIPLRICCSISSHLQLLTLSQPIYLGAMCTHYIVKNSYCNQSKKKNFSIVCKTTKPAAALLQLIGNFLVKMNVYSGSMLRWEEVVKNLNKRAFRLIPSVFYSWPPFICLHLKYHANLIITDRHFKFFLILISG